MNPGRNTEGKQEGEGQQAQKHEHGARIPHRPHAQDVEDAAGQRGLHQEHRGGDHFPLSKSRSATSPQGGLSNGTDRIINTQSSTADPGIPPAAQQK